MMKKPSIKKIGLTAGAIGTLAIAVPFIGEKEGLETRPYMDIGGVLTVCYGETEGVENRVYTEKQCETMLNSRVNEFHIKVMELSHPEGLEMPVTMQAAVTSFVYNVGEGNFARSTMLKKIKRRDFVGACKELDRWVYVGRTFVRGLANRRKAEKELCMKDLPKDV